MVERFLDLVAEGKFPNGEDGRAQSLAWALDAPAGALRSVHEGFLAAENTVEQLLGYVTHFLGDTEMPTGSLEEVQQTGQRIQQATEAALRDLEVTPDD
jgi:hypothetical protein